jgi:LPXTG-site transpeptidase (sortase) family protein
VARLSRRVPAAFLRLLTALVLVLGLGSCSAGTGPGRPLASPRSQQLSVASETAAPSSSAPPASPDVTAPAGQATSTPPPARQGTVAAGARIRFVPQRIELPSGDSAVVESTQTVNGVLQVPDDVGRVGWWDGSSHAGDPFGSTVLAGHVDSREQGLGFFAELLLLQVGDVVTLRSDAQAQSYRVVSTTLVQKDALASESQALGQTGPHRLVLITCSGQWHPEIRSYDSNLVVLAEPLRG